jgi:AraC-like DNA-binding protein
MPSSVVRRFDDPDEYAAAMRAVRTELTITARGQFAADLTRVDLHDLWMQRFDDNLPRVRRSVPEGGRVIMSFRTRPGPELLWNGFGIQPSSIIGHTVGGETYQRSAGNAAWGSMSLPIDRMALISAALYGRDLTLPRETNHFKASPDKIAKLRRLHSAAGFLAQDAPGVIAAPETARSLEQALVGSLIACLSSATPEDNAPARYRHEAVMRRFHGAVEEHPGEAIYIPDLCAAIGVPQRTLHMCCVESLGIGPKRYLLLRRMNLARKALRGADAAAVTVTQIATKFGFWNFGRFSVEYRSLFSEMPSATLHTDRARHD